MDFSSTRALLRASGQNALLSHLHHCLHLAACDSWTTHMDWWFQSHNLMVNLRGWWILLALLCFTKIIGKDAYCLPELFSCYHLHGRAFTNYITSTVAYVKSLRKNWHSPRMCLHKPGGFPMCHAHSGFPLPQLFLQATKARNVVLIHDLLTCFSLLCRVDLQGLKELLILLGVPEP